MAFSNTPPDNSPLVSSSAGQGSKHKKAGGLAAMSPANFGMVMATGIVSIAAHMLGHPLISQSLFVLNNGLFLLLCVLTLLRALRYPRHFFDDMVDHLRGPGFFTTVVACSVLGSQYLVLRGDSYMGRVLWMMALALWVVLTYTIFTALTIKRNKPSLDKGINGGWLLAVVATQSISVSSALLATTLGQPFRLELNFLALSMWLWGGMLYIWTMALIFYRYTFFRLSAGDLTPPYWINMGAMAISTLAGSLLIGNAPDAPYLQSVLPFLKGFTIFYWASGTWWIPMLLILGIWRYGYRRFPFEYDPLYWGAVFPLGMYAACTWQMDHVMGFGFLQQVPRLFFLMALVAWVCTAYGALASVYRLMRHNRFRQG
ncbi:tellurite resistance/C4-dicarboxylate transporter family protein [Pusillimonas sp. ANT_WB101]|uniref:tellurite resistance/C4-dicarboxylate transporter family protein n=1 Tax=Pusillimonas sp. ANT_WB101 TaxID=2597356 RepID=UPI0011EC2BE2|nr:tellurite resistance/C4-dicarboxylate transporter family protein [Pusillimonas sp. ANT_WB101]KAA0911223.1 C4-dicarboxylate ABC transporter [Pusillimonas sp. ANT_WB101]